MELTINILLKKKFIKMIHTLFFSVGEQPLNLVTHKQWQKQKIAFMQGFLSGIASSWFLRFHESF